MNELKAKLKYYIFIFIIVIILLISNIGQNYKNDIFLYYGMEGNFYSLKNYNNKSKTYQEYINSSSSYIESFLKGYGFKPAFGNSYSEEFKSYTSLSKYKSSLEIISQSGKVVKTYKYGEDFFENFKGNTSTGLVKSTGTIIDSYNGEPIKLTEIVLFDKYPKGKEAIKTIDSNLKFNGAAAVITPAKTGDLLVESSLYDNPDITGGGLVKFIALRKVYDELLDYAKNNYIISIKSGNAIVEASLKNIYGKVDGKDLSLTPLIITVYYDSYYKILNLKEDEQNRSLVAPSIILEIVRCLENQRITNPKRTLIFAFVSGYMQNKAGFQVLLDKGYKANIVSFDGFGTSLKYTMTSNKDIKDLCKIIEEFMGNNGYSIISKNYSELSDSNIIGINSVLHEDSLPNPQLSNKGGKILLSFIGDECYTIGILSSHFREIRIVKNFIKENSAVLSIITLFALFGTIFFKSVKN